jgi:hypothetical protein
MSSSYEALINRKTINLRKHLSKAHNVNDNPNLHSSNNLDIANDESDVLVIMPINGKGAKESPCSQT